MTTVRELRPPYPTTTHPTAAPTHLLRPTPEWTRLTDATPSHPPRLIQPPHQLDMFRGAVRVCMPWFCVTNAYKYTFTSLFEARQYLLSSDQRRALRKFFTFCSKTVTNLPQHGELAVEAAVRDTRQHSTKYATAMVKNGESGSASLHLSTPAHAPLAPTPAAHRSPLQSLFHHQPTWP